MISVTELMREFHNIKRIRKVEDVLEKYAKYCLIGCKICLALYAFTGVTLSSNFIFVKLITGELVLPFGFKLPWFDPFSFWGYLVNLTYQLVLVFICVMGFIYADSIYVTIIMHVYCIYDVLEQFLDEFDQSILSEKNNIEIEKQLVFIINLHQRLLRLVVQLLEVINLYINQFLPLQLH